MAVAGQNFFLRLMIEYGFFSGNKLCQRIYLLQNALSDLNLCEF